MNLTLDMSHLDTWADKRAKAYRARVRRMSASQLARAADGALFDLSMAAQDELMERILAGDDEALRECA